MSFTYVRYPIQKKRRGKIHENLTAVGKQITSVEFPILFWASVN